MIRITPKTVTASDQITGYAVRAVFQAGPAWSPASLVSVSVVFFGAQRRTLDRTLAPAQVLPTPAQLAAISAVAKTPTDTAQSWVERASASFVQAAYGLTPAPASAPSPKPPAPNAPIKKT